MIDHIEFSILGNVRVIVITNDGCILKGEC